jgi:beta-carotene 3-hydroxylase
MLETLTAFTIVAAAFGGMELFSGLFHKYVMHGPLWIIHKTHHVRGKGFFELNDVFSFTFGAVATALVLFGAAQMDWRLWAGVGIILYGAVYFVVHDVFIHRRFKWIERTNIPYVRALQRAHKAHHKHTDKHPGEEYGLLWIGKHFFREEKELDELV